MKKSTSSKMRVGAAALAVAVLLAVYLWAALRPGVWLRNAFLYQQADGSFSGRDSYGRYALDITSAPGETDVQFCLDDVPTRYRICTENSSHVEIYREEQLLFSGGAQGETGDALLWKDSGGLADDICVVVNGEYTQEDLQPSCQWLYNVAIGGRRETRGDVSFLVPMALLAILLVLDVKWPRLFWQLRHGLEVSGGEPSEWYFTCQKMGRAAMALGIVLLAVASFAVH